MRRSSHCDCCLDNILELSDGFEKDLVPVDSQVRCIIADEPDVESGVAGRPDRADLQPVPHSEVQCIIAGEPDLESGVEEITGSNDDN